MIKSLLTSVALVATVLTANATDIVLFEGSEDMANNYYPGLVIQKQPIIDAGANSVLTIDFTKTGDGVSYKLCTNWTNTVLPSFENTPGYSEEWNTVYTQADSPITFTFTEEDVQCLAENGDQFRISGGGDGFVITKVTLSTDVEIDPNLLFEGEYTAGNWNSGANISSNTLKVGDILEYTISNPGSEDAQLLVKGSD